MTFPANYIEQRFAVDRLVQRVTQAESKTAKVTIRSFYEPTQKEWEDAYVQKTSRKPPIPPGVKLVWYDLRRMYPKLYSTAYDQDGGLTSSGQVYEYTDHGYQRSPLRFLAKSNIHTGFGWANGKEPFIAGKIDFSSPSGYMFKINMDMWSRRGLISLLIFYELKAAAASNTLQFLITTKTANNVQPLDAPTQPDNQATNIYQASVAAVNLGANTYNDYNGTTITSSIQGSSSTIISNSGTPAEGFMTGMVSVHNVAHRMNDDFDLLDRNQFGQNMSIFGQVIGTGFTTGQLYMHYGILQRTDGVPSFSAPTPIFGAGSGVIRTPSTFHAESQCWLYGLFADTTDELSEFSR